MHTTGARASNNLINLWTLHALPAKVFNSLSFSINFAIYFKPQADRNRNRFDTRVKWDCKVTNSKVYDKPPILKLSARPCSCCRCCCFCCCHCCREDVCAGVVDYSESRRALLSSSRAGEQLCAVNNSDRRQFQYVNREPSCEARVANAHTGWTVQTLSKHW